MFCRVSIYLSKNKNLNMLRYFNFCILLDAIKARLFRNVSDYLHGVTDITVPAPAPTPAPRLWACQRLLVFSQGWIACLPWQQAHHLLVTERFVFVTVWWCDWVPQGALASPWPPTSPTHLPTPQSDVSELWISLVSYLWNIYFQRGLEKCKHLKP